MEQKKKTEKILFSTGDYIAITAIVIGLIFNILTLRTTNTSLQQSQASLNILANKEGVYLEPSINVDALMYKNSQLGSPKIYISNDGKVEAINVVAQIIRRQFNGEDFVGSTWGMNTKIFEELKVYETKEISLPDEYVINPEYNVIELRIYYTREYDKKSYSYRTFYFYGPYTEGIDFKSWYNIKQARQFSQNLFEKVISKSEELPANLYNNFEDVLGSELLKFTY